MTEPIGAEPPTAAAPTAAAPAAAADHLSPGMRRLFSGPADAGAAEPVPAATVILFRDASGAGGATVEVLMLHRNSKLAFGGMWVFPGGRVDPGDIDPAHPEDSLGAARRAAVREAQEEAGLLLDAADLVPFSHWTPPAATPRRFATWFFVAVAPVGGEVRIDDGEIKAHQWLTPAEVLRRRDAGEVELAPPTWVTLARLWQSSSAADAVEQARAREPEVFLTRIAMIDGGAVALWHGDAGYDVGDATLDGPRHRLQMTATGWVYHRPDGSVVRAAGIG